MDVNVAARKIQRAKEAETTAAKKAREPRRQGAEVTREGRWEAGEIVRGAQEQDSAQLRAGKKAMARMERRSDSNRRGLGAGWTWFGRGGQTNRVARGGGGGTGFASTSNLPVGGGPAQATFATGLVSPRARAQRGERSRGIAEGESDERLPSPCRTEDPGDARHAGDVEDPSAPPPNRRVRCDTSA